jgi:hypothetical protein
MWVLVLIACVVGLALVFGFGAQRLFLCRISFLALLVLLIFPLGVKSDAGQRLLIGAFDLESFWEGSTVGLLLFLALWAVRATSDTVLELGAIRVGHVLPGRPSVGRFVRDLASVFIVLAHLICILSVSANHWLVTGAGFLAGLIFGAGLYAVVSFGIWHMLPGSPSSGVKVFAALAGTPAFRLPLINRPAPKQLWRGYLILQEGKLSVLRPHIAAALSLLTLVIVYVAVRQAPLPPLSYLILLVAILVWLCSGIAFFFDTYRIPLVLPLVIWITLFAHDRNSDHYYPLTAAEQTPEHDGTEPGEILAWAQTDNYPIVLIAAAGGGIQAAAWTSYVLASLDDVLGSAKEQNFAHSIRLLSGVSGGSVGLMYYLHGAFPLSGESTELQQAIVGCSEDSSLGPAVQGFAYSDLIRSLTPFLIQDREKDRARGLERAWIQNCNARFSGLGKPGLEKATLKQWRSDLRQHQRPALIFNSTVVETGQRFTFSTSRFRKQDIAQGQADFDEFYDRMDVAVSTAARLSATFPFVSPAARPDLPATAENNVKAGKAGLHLVDGGYFDNSGLVALTTWLDAALQTEAASKTGQKAKEILVMQILPFPEPGSGSENVRTESGPFFQTLSPLQTVMNVRNQVQAGFSQRDFSAFSKRWELDPAYPVRITFVDVSFPKPRSAYSPPLSWHLRASDKAQIEAAWQEVVNNGKLSEVKAFFARNLAR